MTEPDLKEAVGRLAMEVQHAEAFDFEKVRVWTADLRAAIELAALSGWETMETAPRDGSRFLACGGGCEGVETCSWSESVGCWNLETYTADDCDDEPDGYNRPTHWRPLPAPPSGRP